MQADLLKESALPQMNFATGAWLLLAGFISISLISYLLTEFFDSKKATFWLVLSDQKKRKKKILNLKIFRIICWTSCILWLILLLQGIYLIQSGYSVEIGAVDPALLGKTATRTRGKGGLILLLIKYFPYLLIIGSGGMFSVSLAVALETIPKEIRRLEKFERDIQSASNEEKQILLDKILNIASQLQKNELQKIEKLEIKEKKRKEALNGYPDWLEDETQEGWLFNADTSKIKRFYKEHYEKNKQEFIKEETGEIRDIKPPVITKTLLLTKREALSDWRYYLKNGWIPTTPKWK